MGFIKFDNQVYEGRNITIRDNKVMIDGKERTPKDTLNVNIIVEGDIDSLNVDMAEKIAIAGRVGVAKTMSGDLHIKGNVNSSAKSQSGNITIDGDLTGDAKTMSGNIKAAAIHGKASSMSGNVRV